MDIPYSLVRGGVCAGTWGRGWQWLARFHQEFPSLSDLDFSDPDEVTKWVQSQKAELLKQVRRLSPVQAGS